mgnify:CR=1 FL=1
MKGFYTKTEAAHVLGVSPRQINNYFLSGKLTRVYSGAKAWIPRVQVEELYARAKRGPILSQEVVEDISDRVEKLETEVGVLKLGLGFGAKRALRVEADLLLLRQQMVDGLTKKAWSRRHMSKIADELKTIREEEVSLLIQVAGVAAWAPMVDLSKRMLDYAEGHEDYPDRGLDVVAKRMRDARDRFYGLVYASSKVAGLVPSEQAERALEIMVVPVNSIERHIAAYMAS